MVRGSAVPYRDLRLVRVGERELARYRRCPARLDARITAVEADDQPELHSFARGLRHDYDAVLNGLTLSWNSGVAEGNVNRLKMIKRQMYGRASFVLLRKRVLLTP